MILFSPFEQFLTSEIYFYKYNLIMTNVLLSMLVILGFWVSFTILNISTKKRKINMFRKYISLIYNFVHELINSYLKYSITNLYFPFLLYLFLFILISNLMGLLPFVPTLTSNFYINIGLSSIVWFGVLIIGLQRKGIGFMHMFYPRGASAALMLLLGVIELMSWIFRIFSLALRLLANMIAGHILLYCISYIAYEFLSSCIVGFNISILTVLFTLLPLGAFVFFMFFETGVALLQAYIFLVLSCIYINEVY